MTSEESGRLVHEHGKREPIAAANLAWVLGIAAAFCVATKAFVVAGFSAEGALLVLRSTNVVNMIIGMLAANIQFTSFVILLYVLALYMQAEWPRPGRHEREVNVLAIVLSVCALMVIIVGAWPCGLVTLIVGGSYLLRQLGPLDYPASQGWPGSRARATLISRQARRLFVASLDDEVLALIRRADVPAALQLLSNPPEFAEAELKELAEKYDSGTGVAASQQIVMRLALFFTGLALFGLLASPRPWVSPEQLQLSGGAINTGYILGEQGDDKVVLWRKERKIEVVKKDNLKARRVCQIQKPYPTLLTISGISSPYRYPRCA